MPRPNLHHRTPAPIAALLVAAAIAAPLQAQQPAGYLVVHGWPQLPPGRDLRGDR